MTAADPTRDDAFDLIVIGAGINGAGIARDASRRGLRTLLLDASDIGSRTSAWNTRLIHGGLRYLEHYEFGLVAESLRERAALLTIAPHLVKPIRLVLPITRRSGRSPFTIRLGMRVYDMLARKGSLPKHRMLSTDRAAQVLPGLDTSQTLAAVAYSDAQCTFPERLTLENVLDAVANGCVLRTHCPVTRVTHDNNTVTGVEYHDDLTDTTHHACAPLVVNAAGPWVDRVLDTSVDHKRFIGGTRGSHIVIAPFPDAPTHAVYLQAQQDGRPFFIVPWQNLLLIGTTDIHSGDDPGAERATPDEVRYLLDELNAAFPNAAANPTTVLMTYCGVRPLPHQPGVKPGKVTRKHIIHEHDDPRGLISIIGGKLTTYRSLAEQTVDRLARRHNGALKPCTTESTLLPGAPADPAALRAVLDRYQLDSDTIDHLITIYGTRAQRIARLARDSPALRTRIPQSPAIAAEIIFAINDEHARTLSDILLRRTMIGLSPGFALGALDAICAVLAAHTTWSSDKITTERADYQSFVTHFFRAGFAS